VVGPRPPCSLGSVRLSAGAVAEGLPAHGQRLPIATNTALFSLLGTPYGGDSITTFALPDLRPVEPKSANGIPLTYTLRDSGIDPARD
jgi:microcystin-dependent protein